MVAQSAFGLVLRFLSDGAISTPGGGCRTHDCGVLSEEELRSDRECFTSGGVQQVVVR